jgi:hemerythrin
MKAFTFAGRTGKMQAIKKVSVTDGVYWIEVPEAKLYVLCGCPADSVKHLMKRGLIVHIEKDGVQFETGPNAILLSDVLVQNGAFSNLAEWPVLQMLYRQGLILPDHPNNTGIKPLIMGSEAQVRAQLKYIYRGNYGLVSEEEMTAAGMSKARAREEMRLKLKFAFGRIKDTAELLDSLVLGPEAVEIRNGVHIRRVATNQFEFSFKDDKVRVDLNLPKNVQYSPPYPLGFQDSGREYFAVVHSGDGDGWDVDRPCMSSVLMYQGRVYLLDAGPNILFSLRALGIGVNEIEGVFHTHAHDDHFCGLTTLMQADHRIKHYSTPPVRASVAKKWAALVSRPEEEFEAYFDIRSLTENVWNDVEGLEVKPLFSPHPVETTIMYFRAKDETGYRYYAHLADTASKRVLDTFLTDDPDEPGLSKKTYDKVWRNYLMRADVKKIDIGGGLIHGDAADFRKDKSGKIILSHTDRELTNEEKEIGSGATFGMLDRFIEGKQDFIRSRAYHYLTDYLPGVETHELKMLMNNDIVEFNPETLIIKRGDRNTDVHLIVTGVVERIISEHDFTSRLAAGSLVGDSSALTGKSSDCAYRAATAVRALRLPPGLLLDVIKANGLHSAFERMRSRSEILRRTWLFGGFISATVHNRLTRSMHLEKFKKGEILGRENEKRLFLITKGRVELKVEDNILESVGPGDFCGEGCVLFDNACLYHAEAASAGSAFVIDRDTLLDMPVIRWKLFETYKRRMESLLEPGAAGMDVFRWKEDYALGVDFLDREHRRLFESAQHVYRTIQEGRAREEVCSALTDLAEHSRRHFETEEEHLNRHGYPDARRHAELHGKLQSLIEEKCEMVKSDNYHVDLEFLGFLKHWVLDHIVSEDMRFKEYLED